MERHLPIEEMECFRRYVAVAAWAWRTVMSWPDFARRAFGDQLVRACDSVGANLVEGDGRYSTADGVRLLVIARASAREARYWVQLALERELVPREEGLARIQELASATQLLNNLIRHRRERKWDRVSDEAADYTTSTEDPFNER